MSINALRRQTENQGMLQNSSKNSGKYSNWVPSIARRVNNFILGTIALYALASIPGADAGPLAYAACVAECLALTLGGFVPACLVFCAPALAAPTP